MKKELLVVEDNNAHVEVCWDRFQRAIELQVNMYGVDAALGTPDYEIAKYLVDMLKSKEIEKIRDIQKTFGKDLQEKMENKALHIVLMDRLKASYEKLTGEPFLYKKKDFIIADKLIKQFGYEKVVEKIKLLGLYCRNKSKYYTKEGWANFGIGQVSVHWTELLPETSKRQDWSNIFQELKEKDDEQARLCSK